MQTYFTFLCLQRGIPDAKKCECMFNCEDIILHILLVSPPQSWMNHNRCTDDEGETAESTWHTTETCLFVSPKQVEECSRRTFLPLMS